MQSLAQRPVSLPTIVLIAVTGLWIALAALPTDAQSSVPASAVEAAKQPEVAARLAHPSRRPASPPQPAGYHSRPLPPLYVTLYYNGPVDGSVYAWPINSGYLVTNSFTLRYGTTITGFQFGAWAYPSDTPVSVDYSIGTSPFTGNPSNASVSSQFLFRNSSGFDVYQVTVSGLHIFLQSGGTYWLTLQDAQTTQRAPLYWDQNNGPSQAEAWGFGTIPSESFSVQGDDGDGYPYCYQGTGNLRIIYDFTTQQGGPYGGNLSGVAMDRAGNLYGTSYRGGDNSAGLAFKLSNFGGWLLDPLFSFPGGNDEFEPSGTIVSPEGSLFGFVQGGTQSCGGQYCGLIFQLAPQPVACRSALCGWNQTVAYRFTDASDGYGGDIKVSAFDQQGNLYGATDIGGTNGKGTVFQLMPSGGGWTKTILHSFTGGSDGDGPTQVLVGNDGNLYGTTAGGGLYGDGVVFQLTPSGGQWIPSVVYTFGGGEGDNFPASLVQDSAGNLYGLAENNLGAAIFALLKTGSGWNFSQTVLQDQNSIYLNNLAIDAGGNLYGTGEDFLQLAAGASKPPGGGYESYNSFIFKASLTGNTWHYQQILNLRDQELGSNGSLALDASGNLYGTGACGAYNAGTVWQLSP